MDRAKARLAEAEAALRRVGTASRAGAERTAPTTQQQPVKSPSGRVRAWARSQGVEVADRGRLSVELLTAYNEAHPGEHVMY